MGFSMNGHNTATTCKRRWPTISKAIFLVIRSATGIFRDPRRTSVLRFPIARAITGTFGSMRPLVTSPRRKQWCDQHGEELKDWWRNPNTEIHHFIGKDITYFHTLFWPAMLKTAGYQLPTKIHIHGFLTVGGEKMSKRKGTFVKAETFLKHLNPIFLRYYIASKLGPRLDDLDLIG